MDETDDEVNGVPQIVGIFILVIKSMLNMPAIYVVL